MENFVIRNAVLEDREAVLAINKDAFGGRDYLPALYDRLLTSPNTKMFVLLLNNEIVAFSGITIVDGGYTGFGRGGRSSPVLEGHGLGFKLIGHSVEWAKKRGVKKANATELLTKDTVRKHLLEYDVVVSKTILAYMMKVNNLRPLLAGQSPETPRDVTEANLVVYFGSKTFISYLLPKERLLINGIPYKPLNSNIPLIMKTNDITAIFTDVVIQNETCSGLLSVGTLYPVKRPTYAYNIEIYGEDFNSLERHIVRHLERIVDKAFGEVSLYIYVDEKLPPTTMDRLMSSYGAQKYAIQKSKSGDELTVKRVLFEDKDKSGQIFSRY